MEFTQKSFAGGMNLLAPDTQLADNQYRIGFNLRNRYGDLEPTFSSIEDTDIPLGIIQESLSFGNYAVIFVSGYCWYRPYNATGWKRVTGFKMSSSAPRLWTAVIPLATTNYVRLANPIDETMGAPADAEGGIRLNQVTSAFQGNNPGLLVQDNLNQPQFIYIDPTTNLPKAVTTQTFAQWGYTLVGNDLTVDNREYVPIGNCMAWVDGILYVVSPDFETIYRSVSGRPLDFVVNVNVDGSKGADANSTSYSVGVGGISCIRPMSDGSLFVAASNSNFSVAKNFANNAPKLFGEYTFVRKFLFNATCLSDRTIIDSQGDTRFIALTGVRSFNAILQEQNEGRNSLFSSNIQSVLTGTVQSPEASAAILYDNYEFYSLDTIFGPVLAVFDTLANCWTAFDDMQVDGKRIKMLFKIELTIQRLFAITEDNRFFTLYQNTTRDTARVRVRSYAQESPSAIMKLMGIRGVLDEVTENVSLEAIPIVDNRQSKPGELTKTITYAPAPTILEHELPDINTMVYNYFWAVPEGNQGYKMCCIFSWTGNAKLHTYALEYNVETPMNPATSQ